MREVPAYRTRVPWPTPGVLRHRLGLDLRRAVVGAALISALIGCVQLLGYPVFFASWASSATLLLTSPQAPTARPHRVGLSHLVTALIGLACHSVMPNTFWAIGLAVGLSIGLCMLADIIHPPAAANAAFAFVTAASPIVFLMVALLGALGLAAFALASDRWGSSAQEPVNA
ncbi:HPP family protein [Sphingomonas oryzagri]